MRKNTFLKKRMLLLSFAVGGLISPVHASSSVEDSYAVATQQQQSVIKGIVLDARDNEPIIGATVHIKSLGIGTITDIEGKYELKAPIGSVISISYIGYDATEVRATQEMQIVKLKENTELLDDIVVVGFGVQKKANLTGSVATVDSKTLEARPIQNISSGLQGLMPGVSISATNGAPGMDEGNIRIRGTGTLNTASPYILVDGVETGTLSSVDPNDIESISVLKDAASAAIYGSKASNGVILITTKRGSSTSPQVSYSGYFSLQNTTETISRLNSYDYARMYTDLQKEAGQKPSFTSDEIDMFKTGADPLKYPNTDWHDLAYRTGMQYRHNVNVSGSSEHVRYMASAGFLDQKGVLKNTDRRQFNARTNLDIKISNRLNALVNLAYINNRYNDASSAYYGGSSDEIIRQLNLISPWIVARYPDGTWGTSTDGSPIAWLDSGMKVKRDNRNFSGTLGLDYKILDVLKVSVNGSYISDDQDYTYFQKFIQYNPDKATEPNRLDKRAYSWNRATFDALLNYDQTFGKHNLKGLLGWHTEDYNYKYQKAYRENFPNNELTDINAGDPATQKNEGYTRKLTMISWFGRINYDYSGKYLLEANIRADASSRFAKDHRWGYFPSFSGAWRISEEEFMEGTKGWLSNLKLRASWGQLGNQAALDDYYPAISTYNLGGSYPFGGSLLPGYYQSSHRLSNITWEKSSTWGFGLDLGFLDNKIVAEIDYYNRKTTDIIMDVSVPTEFALDPYKDNVGAMRNSGVEFTLSYNDHAGDFNWGASLNFAYNKNKILNLGGVDYMTYESDQRNSVGKAFHSYYIYKTDGFFNSQEEASAFQTKYGNPFGGGDFKAGDLRYVDTNNDGKLDGNDRVHRNSTEPVYTFGLNLNAAWKGIDISLLFNGAAKSARLFDSHEVFGAFVGDAGHPATIWKDAWTPENQNAKMPRRYLDINSPSSSRNAQSTFWLQDTSYLRLKNLQIGYTFPRKWMDNWGLKNLRIYYSAENLFTWDKMKINIDPEATSARLSSYPLLRTHAIGVNVTF